MFEACAIPNCMLRTVSNGVYSAAPSGVFLTPSPNNPYLEVLMGFCHKLQSAWVQGADTSKIIPDWEVIRSRRFQECNCLLYVVQTWLASVQVPTQKIAFLLCHLKDGDRRGVCTLKTPRQQTKCCTLCLYVVVGSDSSLPIVSCGISQCLLVHIIHTNSAV